MLLAEKGLPTSANAGYELFDKMGSMGLTSFMQEITRLRALEGEIARTIQAMKGVKGARVHIVLQDAGSFRRARQPPSASVIIRTETAGDFSSAPAIRHLVAAAIPGMNVDQVTVLSTEGTILASGGDAFNATPARMLTLERTVAKELQDNVRKTLSPYLGLDNFEVSVAARLNTDKRQTNETNFNPDGKAERSVRTVKETGSAQNSNAGRTAVGVEQNIPADQAATPGGGEQTKKQNERREELTNYEVSSKTIQTVSEGYKIEGLTIAVVVNRKRMLASLGEGANAEALDKQLKEVERLVGSAAGVDAKRGDRITIAAVDFLPNDRLSEPAAAPGILAQLLEHAGSFIKAGTMLAITMLLIWFGLRPATRALLEAKGADAVPQLPNFQTVAPGGLPQAAEGPQSAGSAAMKFGPLEVPNLIADLTSKMGRTPQKRLEQMIDFDDEQAAAILKQWMRGARSA
jgi:flagellar M-ring protein FliF